MEITCQVKSGDIETTEGALRRQIFADGPQPEISRNQICKRPKHANIYCSHQFAPTGESHAQETREIPEIPET